MSAPRPAASPRCCSRAGRGGSTRSMSGRPASCAAARRSGGGVAGGDGHPLARSGAFRRAAGLRRRSTSASSRSSWCCRHSTAVATAGATRRADQAAIRGWPESNSRRASCAIPRSMPRCVRTSWLRGRARMECRGHHSVADRGRRGEQGIPDGSAALVGAQFRAPKVLDNFRRRLHEYSSQA